MKNEGGSYKCSPCANRWLTDPGKETQFECTTCVESKGEQFEGSTNKCGCQPSYTFAGGVCLKIPNDEQISDPSFMFRSIRQSTGSIESTRVSGTLDPVVFQKYFKKA